ncbi:Ig-like domain-containing protein [Levilactobacillus angrenensis]|uniref:Ig-like domain-containing protein n=2 Tax=Levilactobacillus angrenensis TaxID=2486020 RepID=A0ABW1UA05_9LACO
MRGRKHYTKNSRKILFQKGVKGSKIVLKNSKGQTVKKFTVKKNGKFSVKLTKKQAKKLNNTKKGKKYFTFTITQKGYKAYTVKYMIKK